MALKTCPRDKELDCVAVKLTKGPFFSLMFFADRVVKTQGNRFFYFPKHYSIRKMYQKNQLTVIGQIDIMADI